MSSPTKKAKTNSDAEIQSFLDETNQRYEELHLAYEQQCTPFKIQS